MIGSTRASILADVNRQSSLAAEIAKAQTQISTTKRIQAPSDDPSASARIAVIRREQADEKTWSSNLDAAAATASRVDSTLASTSTAMTQAIELMTQAANQTLSPANRAVLASQIAGLADDVAGYRDTTDSSGQPLFPDGAATQIPVGKGQTLAASDSKAKVFGGIATASGTSDAVSILRAAAAAVNSGDTSAISASLTDVSAAGDHVGDARAVLGVSAARIDAAKARLDTSATTLTAERSGLEDTDLTAAVTQLQTKLLTLQAAQSAFAQVNRQTLFDKLS